MRLRPCEEVPSRFSCVTRFSGVWARIGRWPSRPHLAKTPTRWWPFPKGLMDFASETLKSRQLLRISRFSEDRFERLKFFSAEFDVFAHLATVRITIRLDADLPGRRLSSERALACEQLGELKRLLLRKARAGTQREDHVCHVRHEANTDVLPAKAQRGPDDLHVPARDEDDAPADLPRLRSAVPNWRAGDVIPLPHRSLRAVEVQDERRGSGADVGGRGRAVTDRPPMRCKT